MDIADAVTTEYLEFEPSTRASQLRGAFDQAETARVVVIVGDDGFEGVVSHRELLGSHRSPDQKARSVMRSAPSVNRTEDVRETARLMVESELELLPVFEGEDLCGVVTERRLLRQVQPYLDALTVEDSFTRDLVSVTPETTVGEAIHTLQEHAITRVPVIEEREVVGMVSIDALVDFTVREMHHEQGGAPDGFDAHGGSGSHSGFRTHRGFGERAGSAARMLDLPARDVMTRPAETIGLERPLDQAATRMLDGTYSPLVVTSSDVTWPLGLVTTTDLLRALTWTAEDHTPVQVFRVHLLDDLSRETIAERVDEIDRKYGEMDVFEATIVLHEHEERLRGTPLLRATIRLFTDKGRFSASGEGYGARAAFDEAADTVEKTVLENKERAHPGQPSHDDRVDVDKLLGWWLGE